MHDMEMRLTNDIKQLDSNIKEIEIKLTNVETRLSADIKLGEHRIVIKLGSLMAVLSIGVMTLMKVVH